MPGIGRACRRRSSKNVERVQQDVKVVYEAGTYELVTLVLAAGLVTRSVRAYGCRGLLRKPHEQNWSSKILCNFGGRVARFCDARFDRRSQEA